MTDLQNTRIATTSSRRINTLVVREFGWMWLGGLLLLLLGMWPVLFGTMLPEWLRPFRVILGLLYVLYIPGTCITVAMFPQRHDLDGIERIGLNLGLSVAWVPVLALGINMLPAGINLTSVLWGELISIMLFSGIAIWRRSPAGLDNAYLPEAKMSSFWRQLVPQERMLWAAAVLLVLGVFSAVLWTFNTPAKDEWTTEFYMLGEDGLAENFVRETAVSTDTSLTIGIANHERTAQTYRVEVWAVDAWANERTQVQAISNLQVAASETFEQPISWQMPTVGDNQLVDILLFTENSPQDEPYRQLQLWLNVTKQ